MKVVMFFLALLVALLGISFSVLNAQDVKVNYFLDSAELPLAFIIILAMMLGAILTFVLCSFKIFHQKTMLYFLRKKLERLTSIAVTQQ